MDVAINQDRIARFNLDYSVIRAPSDGRILKRLAEANEIIGSGHPVFLFSSSSTDWILRCNLPDRDVVHLTLMDSASILFDAYPGMYIPGMVSEIGEWADPYTGTYEIELMVFANDLKLVSGFIGRAEIFPSQDSEVILVPARAMVKGKGRSGFLYILENDIPVLTEIRFVKILEESLAVTSGLNPGDEIVIEGGGFIDRQSKIIRKNEYPSRAQ
jgi:multidrug efflux system membrane fusion protein